MEVRSSVQWRLYGAAFLMAVVAGCGGGGGVETQYPPGAAPAPAPVKVGGWSGTFGSAAVVLGQMGFDQLDPGGSPSTPLNPLRGEVGVSQGGRLFVPAGDQLFAFDRYDSSNGPAAALVLNIPAIQGVSARDGQLAVAAGNQVLIFGTAPQSGADLPTSVIGSFAPGCTSSDLRQPGSAYLTPMGQLIVADSFNNRVLIWNRAPGPGEDSQAADIVLGQRRMDTCVANDDAGDQSDDTPSARTMSFPSSVWSDGVRLVVADSGNNRVLIWHAFPTALDEDSHSAHFVLGQETFAESSRSEAPSATTLLGPGSVDVSAEGELAVADTGHNRVLIWTSLPASNAAAAHHVVGQRDFTHGAANDIDQRGEAGAVPSAKTLRSPSGVRFDGRNLIVSDPGNNRVLVWRETD